MTVVSNTRGGCLLFALAGCLSGCSGVQSALTPGGEEAHAIYPLFWTVTGLSAFVMLVVMAFAAAAYWGGPTIRGFLGNDRTVWIGGIVFPVVALTLLLGYGLLVMQAGETRAVPPDNADVTVVGKRWWWEVTYRAEDGSPVVSANELRLPAGRSVAVRLESDNVIHSFWVPRLAGKLDMIPGRTNMLTLRAEAPGVSRGQCAEYCGGAHALMAFYVVAVEPAEYAKWLENEAAPARAPETETERRGRDLFMQNGCGACHSIRGTDAAGTIAPDLTHVGSRMSLAAAALPNSQEAIADWIVRNKHIKPQNLMPEYGFLEPGEVSAIAAYLASLE